tara:strand:+ start:14084 stop:14566 length:483 start_codon:yes stop_codon:yes gene_type:complete
MPSAKLRAASSEELGDMEMDMSSMIDLVFLLLIFFMVSSHLIIIQIDPEVKPPVAAAAEKPENALGRIVINIRADGGVWDSAGNMLSAGPDGGMEEVEAFIGELRDSIVEGQQRPKLHVRADKSCEVKRIKEVVRAGAESQVIDVIFGAFRKAPPREANY